MRLEDIAVIGVPAEEIPRIRKKLRQMKLQGLISKYPVVTTASEANSFSAIPVEQENSQYIERLRALREKEEKEMFNG